MDKVLHRYINLSRSQGLITAASIFQLFFIVLAIWSENMVLMCAPAALVAVAALLADIRRAYYLFALVLPFSIEVELPGGLGTDLPSEPLMWFITGFSVLYILVYPQKFNGRFFIHPVTIALLGHLLWIGITAFLSESPLLSLKYTLAKVWYTLPFFFFFPLVLREKQFFIHFLDILLISTAVVVTIIMIRHGLTGFDFAEMNRSAHPMFRNHVNYAVMLVIVFPYLCWRAWSSEKKGFTWLIPLFLVAIYFSYTRAAIISLVIGVFLMGIIHYRLIKACLVAAVLAVSVGVPYLYHDNKYLDFAPNYERTIAHYNFDNLIEATYKLEDISTMERVYRWVAGVEMLKDKPFFGFGPSTFYSYYQNYRVTAFETYVSNNPEKSGIHNYYLMVAVEQGVFGLILFLVFLFATMLLGERVYHRKKDASERYLVLAATISIIILAIIITINDLIEVDKTGPIFFISAALIVNRSVITERKNDPG